MNRFAISSQGIGEALVRSASSLATGGNTLEESIGLITAANEVAQDPMKVGTTLKTISMYLRAAKTEASEAGEDTTGMAESVSKLRDEILQLTNQKVDIQLDENTFKSTYQILKELSEVWDELTDITQANIMEKIGGKRNANITSALLHNFQQAEKAMKTAQNSSGSALAENEKYLNSIEGKMQKFRASFEAMSTSILSSGMVKGFIEIGTAITGIVTKMSQMHVLLPSIVAAITAISSIRTANKANSILGLITGNGGVVNDQAELLLSGLNRLEKSSIAKTLQKNLSAEQFAAINQQFGLISTTATQAGQAGINAATGISGAFAKAGSSIKSFWGSLSGFSKFSLIASAAIAAVQLVVGAIQKHNQKIIDNANEIQETYKNASDSYRSNMETVTSLQSEYNRLVQGVDKRTNRNKSLSTEDYERYLEIVNQIGDAVPSMVSGFDSQGNAILNYADTIQVAIDKLNDLHDKQEETYTNSIDDVYEGTYKEYKKAAKSLSKDGNEVTKALGTMSATAGKEVVDAFKKAGVEGVAYDNGLRKVVFTTNGLIDSYDRIDSVMTALSGSWMGEKLNLDEVRSSISALGTSVESTRSQILEMTDIAYKTISRGSEKGTGYEWFADIPQDQIERFRSAMDSMWNMDIDPETNLKTIDAFGRELADGFKKIPPKIQDEVADIGSAIEDGLTREDFSGRVKEFLGDMMREGFSNEALTFFSDYFDSFINQFDSVLPEVAKTTQSLANELQIKDLGDILPKQAVSGFEKQVDTYLSNVNTLKTAMQDVSSGATTSDAIKSAKRMLGINQSQALSIGQLQDAIDGMNSGMYEQFSHRIATASDSNKEKLLALMDAVLETGNVVSGLALDIDLSKEASSVSALTTAWGEMGTATGVTTASMSALKERYSDVVKSMYTDTAQQAYELDHLFETSSQGMTLNTDKLRQFEAKYNQLKSDKIDQSLEAMAREWKNVHDAAEKATDTDLKKHLQDQADSIREQIEQAEMLKAQYDGLTSAFNQWSQATQTANQGANYDAVASGISAIKELHTAGKVGTDDYITAIGMMADATHTWVESEGKAIEISKLTHDQYNDYLERVYSGQERMLEQVNGEWQKTDNKFAGMKGLERYFKDGETGVSNFLNDVRNIDSALAHAGANGKWELDINEEQFDNVRKQLGLTVEEADMLAQKLREYGYDVEFSNNMSKSYEEIRQEMLQTQQTWNDTVNKINQQSGSIKAPTVDFRTEDIEVAHQQVEDLKSYLEQIGQSDNKLNLDDSDIQSANEALKQAVELEAQLKYQSSGIMSLNVTDDTDQLGHTVNLLKEFAEAKTEKTVSIEFNDAEGRQSATDKIQSVLSELRSLSDSDYEKIALKLGIEISKEDLNESTLSDYIASLTPEEAIKIGIELDKSGVGDGGELGDLAQVDIDGEMKIVSIDTEGISEEMKTIKGGKLEITDVDTSGIEASSKKGTSLSIKADAGGSLLSKIGSLFGGSGSSGNTVDVTAKISKVEQGDVKPKPVDITGKITKVEQGNITAKPINVTAKIKNVETGGLKTDKSLKVQAKISKLDTSGLKTNQKVDVTARVSQVEATNMHTANTVDVKAKVTKVDTSALKGATGSINVKATISGVNTGNVRATVNATAVVDQVTGLTAPTATVVFNRDSSAVDSYNPPNMTRTITYVYRTSGSRPNPQNISRTITYTYRTVGKKPSKAQGSAMSGGSAFKGGSWGVHGNGIGLVGELAPEILVSKKPPHTVTYVEYFS